MLSNKVKHSLERIGSRYQEVLILKFLEEKSYQEISDIIAKPLGTVASLINKAKQEFRKEFYVSK
jgi:RNA polymerase sigma-70 factor (ECF subfamily)